MRSARPLVFAIFLGLLGWSGIAAAITIDATALTSPTFRIGVETGWLATASVQAVPLAAGSYAFSDEANGGFGFDVDAGGNVTYNPSFENFLDGAGTTTLTVRGFDVTIDATALTSSTFRIAHVFSYVSTGVVKTATMLPLDAYAFDDVLSNQIVFNLDYDGHFQLVPGSEDYLSGAGTPNLVVRGFDFTVDARALASPTFRILGLTPIGPSDTVLDVTGIPGSGYGFYDVASNNFYFGLDADGRLYYHDPDHEAFLNGAGTSSLVVEGYELGIDPCGLAALTPTFSLLGHLVDGAPTTTPFTFVGIPGYFVVVAAGDLLYAYADDDGLLYGLPATFLGIPVTGAGTSTLGIGSCVTSGSVSGSVLADCPAPGTPLLGVHVDAFALGSGDLAGSAVTGPDGGYTMADLPAGSYTITCVTPLGYSAAAEEQVVNVAGGQSASADFALHCVETNGDPRAIGFWKHQVGVATGGNGQAQIGSAVLCSSLDLIAAHFNSNEINQVVVYQPPASGLCADKLQVAKQLLNLQGASAMLHRARQQLMALLLNVAFGYLSQSAVISADGATVSQAITYCDQVIDDSAGDHEKVKTIAEAINNGAVVPAGTIPLGTAQIAYRRGMEAASFRAKPVAGGREFRFMTADRGSVRLALFDVAGRLVAELARGDMEAGAHAVRWSGVSASGRRAAKGVYFARLETPRESATLKVVHLESGR